MLVADYRPLVSEASELTNTKNTPIEAFERAFRMRVLRYRLRRDSGGRGEFPGGEGIERDLEMLEDATVSLVTERRASCGARQDTASTGRPDSSRKRCRTVALSKFASA